MKFSKKLLTVLLPITATSAIVPVVTSCNKGSSWSFSYGDNINCLNKKPDETKSEGKYHSLSDVKNAVTSHIGVDSRKTITETELKAFSDTWSSSIATKQLMYFDLIASNSLINGRAFSLLWNLDGTPAISFSYIETLTQEPATAEGSHLAYLKGTDDEIDIVIMNGSTEVMHFKSYNFQRTTVVGE